MATPLPPTRPLTELPIWLPLLLFLTVKVTVPSFTVSAWRLESETVALSVAVCA